MVSNTMKISAVNKKKQWCHMPWIASKYDSASRRCLLPRIKFITLLATEVNSFLAIRVRTMKEDIHRKNSVELLTRPVTPFSNSNEKTYDKNKHQAKHEYYNIKVLLCPILKYLCHNLLMVNFPSIKLLIKNKYLIKTHFII